MTLIHVSDNVSRFEEVGLYSVYEQAMCLKGSESWAIDESSYVLKVHKLLQMLPLDHFYTMNVYARLFKQPS